MTDLSKKSCVVYDHGYFLELALRLARDVGTVYYACPWEDAMSRYEKRVIGEGYKEQGVIRVEDIHDVIDKVDFAVFPDVHHAGMQLYFEKQGHVVWGARRADSLELLKLTFKRFQEKVGMNYAKYDALNGLEELRKFCRQETDRWIKISPQYRGTIETFHHEDYLSSRTVLDQMGVDLGIMQDDFKFIAERPIKAKLEGGLDTYTVDGQHPKVAVQGYEKKDMCYFAAVQKYEDVPKEITVVNEYLWPVLKTHRCRQFLSTEVKITEEGESYLLEPTVRMPSPAGEEQMEIYANFSEIIYEGAHGNLIEPEVIAPYCCEAMVEHHEDEQHPRDLKIPPEVRQWVKLYNTAQVGDRVWIAPGSKIIGAVVGIGDTPKKALAHLKENAAQLDGAPVTIHVEALVDIMAEIQTAEASGIDFSDEPLPDPAEVVENAT